jgi:predicted nucleic acid-binding protein
VTLVVDSSVAASWALPDESSPAALKALMLARSDKIVVPSVFWHELRNVLLVAERRGRLTADETQTGISVIVDLSPEIDASDDHFAVLGLARRHLLTAYDASYLELAKRKGAVLATLDRRLAHAGLSEGLQVISDQV